MVAHALEINQQCFALLPTPQDSICRYIFDYCHPQKVPSIYSELCTLTSSQRDEILLDVVTVQLGTTEDDGLVHLEGINGLHQIASLEQLHPLRE